MRVTGGVLPVLTHREWRVETALVDLGTGVRDWIVIRRSHEVAAYAATVAERDRVLREHGVDPAELREDPTPEDGCE